jgi:hypothetical protein
VWILVLFYLLYGIRPYKRASACDKIVTLYFRRFFSPWGDLLWDFLMGPLGFLLMLPFAFALLFWILTYVFQSS